MEKFHSISIIYAQNAFPVLFLITAPLALLLKKCSLRRTQYIPGNKVSNRKE
jgi:hypothetical protein